MANEPVQILSYSTVATRGSSFGHVKAIFPFGAGIILGVIIAAFMLSARPIFAVVEGRHVLVIISCLVVVPLYVLIVLIVLALIGSFRKKVGIPCHSIFGMTIGVSLPVFAIGALMVLDTLCILLSPPDSTITNATWIILIVTTLAALAAPFLLARPIGRACSSNDGRRLKQIISASIAGIALIIMLILVGRPAAERKYNRECESLAEWLKTTSPPGHSFAVALPQSQRSLSSDHMVYGFAFDDGRVVLSLSRPPQILMLVNHDSSFVYSSGPMQGMEIIGSQFNIEGLPYQYIRIFIDDRHFIIDRDEKLN